MNANEKDRFWAAHLLTKRNHRQARRSSFDAGWDAAVSVFEKALTPTDDEREDMIAFLLRDHNFEESPWGRTYTDAEIANALRRSEVPEPQGPKYVEVGHPSGERQPVEPQAEPSGIPFYDQKMRELDAIRAQSEPSDAQVEAAWSVLEKEGLTVLDRSCVRAALRAAGGVR